MGKEMERINTEKERKEKRNKQREEERETNCFARLLFFFWTLFDDDEMTNKQKWKGRTGGATASH